MFIINYFTSCDLFAHIMIDHYVDNHQPGDNFVFILWKRNYFMQKLFNYFPVAP